MYRSKKKNDWLKPKGQAHKDVSDLLAAFAVREAGTEVTPNLRALRLAMAVSDLLSSMGVSANNVVSHALDITETYCERPANVTITYNLLCISQVRSVDEEPLTLIRPIPMRNINNLAIQAVQNLVHDIREKHISLEEAEARMDKILTYPANYPAWVPWLANAAIAPTVVVMYTTDWRVIGLTAIAAVGVSGILMQLSRKMIAPFFRQAIASAFVTLFAAVIAWLASKNIGLFTGIDPTLIVVGGIFLLISGLAIVGAVQDAFDEYYLTATARLLRVTLLTMGIVGGILVGMYIARELGMNIAVSPDPLGLSALEFQVLGGALAAAAQALATQTRLKSIIWAGLIGGSSLAIMFLAMHLGLSAIPASGIAAVYVGVMAALFSRAWRTPISGIVACGLLPLVPGVTLYTGLMQLVNYPPGHELFMNGVGSMFATAAAALAIGTGATLGLQFGQPLSSKLTHRRNLASFSDLSKRQMRASQSTARLTDLLLRRRKAKREQAE